MQFDVDSAFGDVCEWTKMPEANRRKNHLEVFFQLAQHDVENLDPVINPPRDASELITQILRLFNITNNIKTGKDVAFVANNMDEIFTRTGQWLADYGFGGFEYKPRAYYGPREIFRNTASPVVDRAGRGLQDLGARIPAGGRMQRLKTGVAGMLNRTGMQLENGVRQIDEALPTDVDFLAEITDPLVQAIVPDALRALSTTIEEGLEVGWTPRQIMGRMLESSVWAPPGPRNSTVTRQLLSGFTTTAQTPAGNLAAFKEHFLGGPDYTKPAARVADLIK